MGAVVTSSILRTWTVLMLCALWGQDTFHNCITKRLSLLLTRGVVRLVVIDSIAALFRCEFGASDSVLKARYLQTFGAQLHALSTRFRTPIMCINQVWHRNECPSRLCFDGCGVWELEWRCVVFWTKANSERPWGVWQMEEVIWYRWPLGCCFKLIHCLVEIKFTYTIASRSCF